MHRLSVEKSMSSIHGRVDVKAQAGNDHMSHYTSSLHATTLGTQQGAETRIWHVYEMVDVRAHVNHLNSYISLKNNRRNISN